MFGRARGYARYVTYLSLILAGSNALTLLLLGLRLWGLRNEKDRAAALAAARTAERDAVLARLTDTETRNLNLNLDVEARGKEIARLWGILRRCKSDEALEELLKEELG